MRRFALLTRRLAGTRARRPYDVEIFGGQRVRLHPYDNRCEKWAYATPQFWDAAERGALAEAIGAGTRAPFVFVDVGANVGLYCLFARSVAQQTGRPIKALAIEPAPVVGARLRANLAFSGADDVEVAAVAVAPEAGPVRLALHDSNQGETRLADGREPAQIVEGAPLAVILDRFGLTRIDAMKIDIEGHEASALSAFFDAVDRRNWPSLLIAETGRDSHNCATRDLCLEKGYRVRLKSRLNTIFQLDPI